MKYRELLKRTLTPEIATEFAKELDIKRTILQDAQSAVVLCALKEGKYGWESIEDLGAIVQILPFTYR